ncbi:Zn-dependent hydrolase [Paenibacillus antri]|uniref:Zn-dependent hydrolase n=1 Tax=Paenibacillus antri TaxID=2582848 RepID=A0A5R9GIR9_9BACL|nr:Zn-dependent hydrolase [Paenibacillus antri]TLS52743.1 Zn-dependent hydrolase [Paenibacillus antri]
MDTVNVLRAAPLMHDVLRDLASFSADGPGVTRLLYSREWGEAQQYLMRRMTTLGFDVRCDRVGNVYGRVEGARYGAPAVLTGSHVDTVRCGGVFDGAYGIAAGIAALDWLRRTYGPPIRPLEIVSFCEEEGSRFPLSYWGSGNVTGAYDLAEAPRHIDFAGISMQEAMVAAGYGREDQALPRRTDIAAFVEAHIEQGVTLERLGHDVGIVTAIVGQKRFIVKLTGEANHAGTTPMTMRRDPCAGAAEIVAKLERMALQAGDPLVATVGRLELSPNTPNVIPGSVTFTIDVRHAEEATLSAFGDAVSRLVQEVSARRGLQAETSLWVDTAPAPMHPALYGSMERISAAKGLSPRLMTSGAGHDAQMLQTICPSAMVFVPSRHGVSHSPEEYSSPKALEDGLEVLIAMLYELAYEERLP